MTKDIQDWIAAIEKFVDEYVDCYELDDDECHHEPTEHERFLIEDAINGLIADEQFTALVAGSVAAERDALRAEVESLQQQIKAGEAAEPARPTDAQIVTLLAAHYRVSEYEVIGWIRGMDLASLEQMSRAAA